MDILTEQFVVFVEKRNNKNIIHKKMERKKKYKNSRNKHTYAEKEYEHIG